MTNEHIETLRQIIVTTNNNEKRTYSLWLLLKNNISNLSTDELIQYIPFIWTIEDPKDKFWGIRKC